MEFLGVRVVRGPDWKWGNQDGGEGNVGTVVHIGTETKSPIKEPIVWVRWDSGSKANYRAGVDGKHDLRVLDSANADVRHIRVSCDGCKQDPIIGFRWHCKTCPNYDLCTQCYMTDSHDVGHQFERYDKSRGQGVAVGTRQGSTKLETRGLFKGAKVVRGCDWEWRDQDGGPNTEGVVKEITSWDDEATKDSVRVAWKKRKGTNIYRVGKHGKVDLKCTVPASGGSYYRDHLPTLIVKQEKSQSGFVTGDKVIVQLTSEQLQELSVGHGEWNADMAKFIGKVGVVHDFASNGDVLVDYPDKLWRYNPKALTKIQKFKRGDEILVKNDKKLVKELQEGHGGWNEALVSILGRIGKVLEVDGDGDLVVSVEGDHWVLNPAAVTYVTDPSPAQATADDGHSTDEPLGGLFHDFFRGLLQRAVVEGIGSHHLVAACKQNNLSRVREILDNHPESIDEMAGGHTALHILEAERSVLEGMQEHKRLLKLQEDSRAAKSLIELESHIKEEEETLEEIQKNSAGLIDELSQRKIDVRNAETELSKLRKELSSVLETFNETKEDDEKLKVELEENSRQLKELTKERDEILAAQLEREQLANQVQKELADLEQQIQDVSQQNAKLQEELPFVRAELDSKLRDKEEAKRLTEKAHELVETL